MGKYPKIMSVLLVLVGILMVSCIGSLNRTAPYKPREYKSPQQTIEVNGLKMAYTEQGKGAQTVILIHGLGGSISNWAYNVEALAANYRVIAVDLPGFGNSDKPDLAYSVKLHADYIYRFMKEKNIEKAVLVGHSMGGQAATIVALDHPEVVSKLVLVSPSGADVYLPSTTKWLTSNQYVRRAAMVATGVAPASYNRFSKIMWRYLERDAKHGHAFALVYDARSNPTEEYLNSELKYNYDFMVSPEFPKFLKAYLRSGASIPVDLIRDELKNVKAPTLIVWGKEDGVVTFENALLFNDNIPVSMMAIFPECGHLAMIEQSDRFNRVVAQFIN